MVETRTGTSTFAVLGGMARGRPVLATLLMTTGIIALAVPGSAAFAGEFLILAGVYGVGWGWAAVGAGAIVLAAMYMLRLISAVLHQARGFDVLEDAPDLRAVRADAARAARRAPPVPLGLAGPDLGAPVIPTPKIDWLALSPTLALLGASGVALLGSVLVPSWMRRAFAAFIVFAGFVTAGVLAAIVFDESAEGRSLIAESFTRDRLGALAAIVDRGRRRADRARLVG